MAMAKVNISIPDGLFEREERACAERRERIDHAVAKAT